MADAAPSTSVRGANLRLCESDGVFASGEHTAAVFRIEPTKVLAFAKDPHAQTRYRFSGR